MKILVIIAALFLVSCSKEKTEPNAPASTASQYISSVKFSEVSAGGSISIMFTITVWNTDNIQYIKLFRCKDNLLVKSFSNPLPGNLITYDHTIDVYPTYPQNEFYQVEITFKNGTKSLMQKFQVY